jgi:hypothetical protein
MGYYLSPFGLAGGTQGKGLPMNNVYTLARAPGGQMQGAATQAMW